MTMAFQLSPFWDGYDPGQVTECHLESPESPANQKDSPYSTLFIGSGWLGSVVFPTGPV